MKLRVFETNNMNASSEEGGSSSENEARVDEAPNSSEAGGGTLPFSEANGQRRYGPPMNWHGPPPGRGSEVFVGHLPRHLPHDRLLLDVFGRVGQLYEMRVMVDYAGHNRGYCFVVYANKQQAQRAVNELHDTELLPGQHIGVMPSVDNRRLFIGGIPRSRTSDELREQLNRLVSGMCDVIQYASATDKSKNRGFAFVEFTSHKAAALARQKLLRDKVSLWGAPLCVDWAEPEQDVDDDIMMQVRILYLRNLLLTTTEEELRQIFNRLSPHPGCIERVKKIKDFAFVHFRQRSEAEYVLNKINGDGGLKIDRVPIEVVWAKPPDRSIMRHVRTCMKNLQFQLLPSGNDYYKAIVEDASRSLLLSQELNQAVAQMPHNNMLYTMLGEQCTSLTAEHWYADVPPNMRQYCGQPIYQAPAALFQQHNAFRNAGLLLQQQQQQHLRVPPPPTMPVLQQPPVLHPTPDMSAQHMHLFAAHTQSPMLLQHQPPIMPQVFVPTHLIPVMSVPVSLPPAALPPSPTAATSPVSTTMAPPPDLISTHVPHSAHRHEHSSHVGTLRRLVDDHGLGNVAFTFTQHDNGLVQCQASIPGVAELPDDARGMAFGSKHEAQEHAALQLLLAMGQAGSRG